MKNSAQKFAEYLGQDEHGNMRMRLGHTIYVEKGKNIYMERNGVQTMVTLEMQVAKPWIRENFERERAFQRRKHVAEVLQRTHIPSYERKAYKRRMGWVGA